MKEIGREKSIEKGRKINDKFCVYNLKLEEEEVLKKISSRVESCIEVRWDEI